MSARKSFSLLACFVCLTMAAIAWSAAAPSKLSYQAVLLNSGGQPVTTSVNVVFTIYDAAAGGNVMWTETRNVTPDALGRVNVMLGDNTPVADPVFNGPDRWLGIQVGVDPEMFPRTQFAASPYSRRVSTVDGSSGGTMEGNLTLRSTAAAEKDAGVAQPAQLTLISLDGDTIVVGPANQLVFRATNASGANLMSATISGPNGPVLGIADPGGNIAEHSGTSSSYYGNSTKDVSALQKQVEVGADGFVIYGATESDTVAIVDNSGRVTSTGVNVEVPASVLASAKDATAVCAGGDNSNCGVDGNNCFGSGLNLLYARSSLAVGGCITLGESAYPVVTGSTAIGQFHLIRASGSLVVGDSCRILEGGANSVAFGYNNEANEKNCFLVGIGNYVGSPQSISMGRGNRLFGGGENYIFGDSSYTADAGDCTIGGGAYDTLLTAGACVIDGGVGNKVLDALFSTIGGGHRNRIDGSGAIDRSGITIAGGSENYATNDNTTIGGGAGHIASGRYATIAGGNYSVASGYASFVGGGDQHTASGACAVIAGGGLPHTISERNVAAGDASFIGSGRRNRTDGEMAVVPGGLANEASGRYSLAAGQRAKAMHSGTFVWADSTDADFTSTAINQFLIRASGNTGINTSSPSSMLHVNGPIATHIETVSGTATLTPENSIVLVSSSPASITIPDPSTCVGRQITIKKIDGGPGAVAVLGATGLIDGAISYSLTSPNKYVTVVSDGTNWWVNANN